MIRDALVTFVCIYFYRDLAGNAKKVGDYFASKLEKLPHVKEVRHQGLLVGVEFDRIFNESNCFIALFFCYDKRWDHTDNVCSDRSDQKLSIQTAMFHIYPANGIIKSLEK